MKNKLLIFICLLAVAFNVNALDIERPFITTGLSDRSIDISKGDWNLTGEYASNDKEEYYVTFFDGEFDASKYLKEKKDGCNIVGEVSNKFIAQSSGNLLDIYASADIKDGLYKITGELMLNDHRIEIFNDNYDYYTVSGLSATVLNMHRAYNKYVIIYKFKDGKKNYCMYSDTKDLKKETIPEYQHKYNVSHTKDYGIESFQIDPEFKYVTLENFFVKVGEITDKRDLKIYANKLNGFERYFINKAKNDANGKKFDIGWEIPATIQSYPTPVAYPIPNSLFKFDDYNFEEGKYYYVYITYGEDYESVKYRDYSDIYIMQYKDDVLTLDYDLSSYKDNKFTTKKEEYVETTTLTAQEIKEQRKNKKIINDSLNIIVLISSICIVILIMIIAVSIIKYKKKKNS